MNAAQLNVVEKTAIAGGWEESGLSQEDWARKHGISARTLRTYLRKYRPERRWDSHLQAAVARAVEALIAIDVALRSPVSQQLDAPSGSTERSAQS